MSKNEWKKWLGVVGRVLLAYAFIFGQAAVFGQQSSGQDKPGQPSSAQKQDGALSVNVKADTLEATKDAAEAKESSRGTHEGITVHGHWTIEVRNQDGSLARRVEFENSLDPGFTIPNPTAGQPPVALPGGAAYLSAVLSGQWSAPVAPQGFWTIALVGPSGMSGLTAPAATNAPCVVSQGSGQLDACLIATTAFCTPALAGTSCNLSVAPLGTTPSFTGLQLSGSVGVTLNGQISTVATLIGNLSCVVTSTPRCLPSTVNTASFTSSTNFPGAPISVIAGQTVAVTVIISFS